MTFQSCFTTRSNWSARMIRVGVLSCLAALLIVVTHARDGRDFAGFYEVVNAVDLGEEVRLTLRLRVFNYSDAYVSGATITLEDSLLPVTIYGSFAFIAIEDQQSVRLEKEFQIPRREYDLWQSGATPSLSIHYVDQAANPVHRRVELAPMLVGEEQ